MNENINIAEILKDAPKGTKLWSPICGDCILDKIETTDTTANYAIFCLVVSDHSPVCFTSDGKYTLCFDDGECVLFPSKENRDWSTFKVPKKHKHFEPFQKVLCAVPTEFGYEVWNADIYSHYDEFNRKHFLISGFVKKDDDDVIPYEGNEDKLGKTVE